MKATLDMIKGDMAVLLIKNGESIKLNMPMAMLPVGCKEGDILEISITRDKKETEESRVRVLSMIERLKKKSQCGPECVQPEE